MNKDKRSNLSVMERQMLILSQEQLLLEINERVQKHIRPDQAHNREIGQFSCLITCVSCKRIPLDVQQCVFCEAVICKPCRLKMKQEESQHGTAACCPQCRQNPELTVVWLKNGQAKAKISRIYESHSCSQDDAKEEPQKMNIYDLKKHLKLGCKKNRSCHHCNMEFASKHEYHDHLKYQCPSVEITCGECDEQLTRREFTKYKHACYKDMKQKMA